MACLRGAVKVEHDGKHESSLLVLDKTHERNGMAYIDE